jgi:CubicO group peptidase (beta-lactamase class C family)
VLVDGKAVTTLDLPDLDEQRARALMEAAVSFKDYAFTGSEFPKGDFADPSLGEDLLGGPYTVDVTYYDRDHKRVARAADPGRYGAVIRFTTNDGRTVTRYRTLYRMPKDFRWWDVELKGSLELPPEWGIDPAVVKEQNIYLANAVAKYSMAHDNARCEDLAILLAGLSEMKAGGGPAGRYDDPWAVNRQWWVTQKRMMNGNAERFAAQKGRQSLTPPQKIDGKPAPVLHDGTLEEAGMKPDAADRIDAVLKEWAADTDEAFIACVARHGVVVLHKAYGTRDGKPMTTETKSYMASLTKLIHGSSMMMLVDQGLVDLDAPAAMYLPELAGIKVATPPTVRHLMTHTAGMWGHWGDDENDFECLVAGYLPYFKVGQKHEYNGMSLALGSKIIEQVSGESLPNFYKHHIVDPLGLKCTDASNASYDAQSVAGDMARIGQMLLNGGAYGDQRFFSPATLQKMLPARLTRVLGPDTQVEWGIGCVWFRGEGLGEHTFGHGAASSATLRIDPDNDLVISMTRRTAGKNFDKYHPRFLKAVAEGMAEGKKP